MMRWQRESDEWGRAHEAYVQSDSSGAIEERYLFQRVTAGNALRYTTHPDPLEAALECVTLTLGTFVNGVTERGLEFAEDSTGRHIVSTTKLEPDGTIALGEREARFVEVVKRLLTTSPDRWNDLLLELPAPLTQPQRAEALRMDAIRQERGDFATWQIV